jgi:hypothetical protein
MKECFFDVGQAMKHTQGKTAHNLDKDPIVLSDDDAMEEPTAKSAAEEPPPTAKGLATPATPEKGLHSPASFTSARKGTRSTHSFNKKRRSGKNRASSVLFSRFARQNSSRMIG